ncbi:hypothetical protein F0562_009901 [Nyssa sinensis]|uniref:Leucine-rich repeat-containing N-terminal plant-type domain-containing protein n=1 Tax=Nyssa sinensis TaxID=561372 RepID=A0A5J5A0J9_9ASTE|nr:hypothetical protein F0562_009901 [Nyssa sinensis]
MESICYLTFLVKLVVCSFCFMVLGSDARQLSSQNDVAALMAFKKSSVDADPNGFLNDWSSSSSSPCSWKGVFCALNDGRVTRLDLANAGVIGRLHLSDLMALPSLTQLHLHGNLFSGDLSSTTRFCRFETIDLSANNLSEPLAAQSSLLSCNRLVSLNVSRNSIPGGSLKFGPSLLQLDLSRNRISDSTLLTYTLSNCQNLNLLNFSDNKLTGKLNDTLSSCKNLWDLDLSYNQLSGEIPASFVMDSPASLRVVDLSHNNFTGDVLSLEFGNCRNLSVLNLSHNSLSGTGFPASLANCQLLETLDIGRNALSFRIPGVLLGKLKNLRRLYLDHNHLSGEIPPELGHICGTLEVLDLSGNQFVGGLPSTFALCSSLLSLNLGNNQLSGDFLSTVVSSLPSLRENTS